ncbi:MAG: hypothetical protein ABIT38_20640, partial [Gemmatimonadaceae bacterium]
MHLTVVFRSARRLSALAFSLILSASAGAATAPASAHSSATASKQKPKTSKPKSATTKKRTTHRTTKKSGAPKDTTKRAPVGSLGPSSGEKHLAYKGMGSDLDSLWPPKMPAPLPGSILPAKRIIAFYGNPLSKRMGILGEFEPQDMLARLDREVVEWNRLDPAHPVQPALHLIAVVAQGGAGSDGKYRARMDSALIEKVYGWAHGHNAIMFLDVQVGLSNLQSELPPLERFLKRPDVHLGIDP